MYGFHMVENKIHWLGDVWRKRRLVDQMDFSLPQVDFSRYGPLKALTFPK